MAEYIEREAAIDRLEKLFQLQAPTARAIIEAIPAADVAPVRHGRWMETTQPCGWSDETCAECSECGEDFVLDEWSMDEVKNSMHYCPNCGAKMDKEETNG